MVEPNYTTDYSLLNNKVEIHGNVDLAEKLICIIRKKCIGIVDLYEAQEMMRTYCIDNYGTEFFAKNAEAIMFLVENEYCNAERVNLPLFDKERYEYDVRNRVVY